MTSNPTTQLVEAIEQKLAEAAMRHWIKHSLSLDPYRVEHECGCGAKYIDWPEASSSGAFAVHLAKMQSPAIILVIADAVDAQIGENLEVRDKADMLEPVYHRHKGINAEKARMRIFTAALREVTDDR